MADSPSLDVAVDIADGAAATSTSAPPTAGHIYSSVAVAVARKRRTRGSGNHVAQDERKRWRRAALLLATQGDTEAGT